MTFFLILAGIVVLAALAPVFGADSRNLAGPEYARDKFWYLLR
jgi:hypothetical protein